MLRFNQKLGFFLNKRQEFTNSQCRVWHLLISTLWLSYWHESLGVSAAQLRSLWESLLVTSGQHACIGCIGWLRLGQKTCILVGIPPQLTLPNMSIATLFGSFLEKRATFSWVSRWVSEHSSNRTIGVSQGSPKRSKLDGDDWIVTAAIRGERSK